MRLLLLPAIGSRVQGQVFRSQEQVDPPAHNNKDHHEGHHHKGHHNEGHHNEGHHHKGHHHKGHHHKGHHGGDGPEKNRSHREPLHAMDHADSEHCDEMKWCNVEGMGLPDGYCEQYCASKKGQQYRQDCTQPNWKIFCKRCDGHEVPATPTPSPIPPEHHTPTPGPSPARTPTPAPSHGPQHRPTPAPASGSAIDVLDGKWDTLFAHRGSVVPKPQEYFTLEHFKTAIKRMKNIKPRYGKFCNTGNREKDQVELLAFLAQTAHETTAGWATAPDPWSWGYAFNEEAICDPKVWTDWQRSVNLTQGPSHKCWDNYCANIPGQNCAESCVETETCPPMAADGTFQACTPGKTPKLPRYNGRGPVQLSWNYNYKQFADDIGDQSVFEHPNKVAKDGVTGFMSAIWFWMSNPKDNKVLQDLKKTPNATQAACIPTEKQPEVGQPLDLSPHEAIHQKGFGAVTYVINGVLECANEHDDREDNRIMFFQGFAEQLGISIGDDEESKKKLRCHQWFTR